MNAYESLWDKRTLIKDSVHGYISIPKPIVKEIIDTEMFQRLKNVGQTGMEVLYPSATHNRFMHSLGVYHLSKLAFNSFQNNVRAYSDIYHSVDHGNKKASDVWSRWEMLFQLSSLLHDCGHAPLSHTLEFIYDVLLEPKEKRTNEQLVQDASPEFKRDFIERYNPVYGIIGIGKPHERMSALYIKSPKGFDIGLKSKIKRLLTSYMNEYNIYSPYNEEDYDDAFEKDIEFMMRMIIGCRYGLPEDNNFSKEVSIELQLRNCIIGMLNSKLDVDNLDYVVRDSKFSGYASNNIDIERLLNSFTIVTGYHFNDLHIHSNDNFSYNVNLERFEGSFIDAKISGECCIRSIWQNISAEGNVILEDREPTEDIAQRSLRTKDNFSAQVIFNSKGDTESKAFIEPKSSDINKVYINIQGKIEGIFTGVILSNEPMNTEWEDYGSKRVFFAYKQNCMSVLKSAVEGSNFENMWIYAHHTTTYNNNFLSIYLLETFCRYLFQQENLEYSEEVNKILSALECQDVNDDKVSPDIIEDAEIEENNYQLYQWIFIMSLEEPHKEHHILIKKLVHDKNSSLDAKKDANIIMHLVYIFKNIDINGIFTPEEMNNYITRLMQISINILRNKKNISHDMFIKIKELGDKYHRLCTHEMQLFFDIVAMLNNFSIQGFYYSKTDDSDLFTSYKQLYMKLMHSKDRKRHEEFMVSYKQYSTRDYMKCMWKTYPDYLYYFKAWTPREIDNLKKLFNRTDAPWIRATDKRDKQDEEIITPKYYVLSDFVLIKDELKEFWSYLKKELKVKRLVYVEQKIKTKEFIKNETYIRNHNRIMRIEDIGLYSDQNKHAEFFYFYYEIENSEDKDIDVNMILNKLRTIGEISKEIKSSEDSITSGSVTQGENMKNNLIIRDNVHGDIEFPKEFARLIDTVEFQRLRRIKQLATAGQVYPSAIQTRFSHALGTYFIMNKIIMHFQKYFMKLDHQSVIDEYEKKAILAAALLHDIGHGPFSHAFEKAEITTEASSHEEWTKKIILDPSTEVYHELESWQKGFSDRVVYYLERRRVVKKEGNDQVSQLRKSLNLEFIFASLVSGQIDADRMDYLLRDSLASGVTYGQFDMDKVIEGLEVSVDQSGEYLICVNEDYLPNIEEYFYARYQMYNNVYYHPYKMLSETLLQKILKRACRACNNGELASKDIPPILVEIFNQETIKIEDYCQIDDNVVMGAIQTWSKLTSNKLLLLTKLCDALLHRRGYIPLNLSDIDGFCKRAIDLFGSNVFEEDFLILCEKKVMMYADPLKKPVYVQKRNGSIVNLKDVSGISNLSVQAKYVYCNPDILKTCYTYNKEKIEALENLIQKFNVNNKLEIEKKYVIQEDKVAEAEQNIINFLEASEYSVSRKGLKEQTDIYYDTDDLLLFKEHGTLRIRKVDDKFILTSKSPITSVSNGGAGQLERNELEEAITSDNIEDSAELINENLKQFEFSREVTIQDLKQKIKIINKRSRYIISKNTDNNDMLPELYEMVFDDVEYVNLNNNNCYKENQLEIELKSSYKMRINMKALTDMFEEKIEYLKAIENSKYERAIEFTNELISE